MITLELTADVAKDVMYLLTREQENYTTVDEHCPERIKSIRQAIDQITSQLND